MSISRIIVIRHLRRKQLTPTELSRCRCLSPFRFGAKYAGFRFVEIPITTIDVVGVARVKGRRITHVLEHGSQLTPSTHLRASPVILDVNSEYEMPRKIKYPRMTHRSFKFDIGQHVNRYNRTIKRIPLLNVTFWVYDDVVPIAHGGIVGKSNLTQPPFAILLLSFSSPLLSGTSIHISPLVFRLPPRLTCIAR